MRKVILLFIFSISLVFAQGSDNASNTAYDDGWVTNDDGGTGFGAWTINTPTNSGVFIGTSDIAVLNKSWGLWANSGATSSAVRDFDNPMGSLDRFTIFMDNGSIQNGGTVGFGLQNNSGNNVIEVYFVGGETNYTVNDGTAKNSNLSYTNQGLKVEVELNSATSYLVRLTKLSDLSTQTVTGTIASTISKLRLFNFNAGSNNDQFFNSISHEIAALPVELTSFSALAQNEAVNLTWETATEVNNYGFEIQRSANVGTSRDLSLQWNKVGFVEGHGNSNSAKQYSYVDNSVRAGQSYSYRLKQIDFDGQFEYSSVVNVEVGVPMEFSLAQNYPNPFNPSTSIEYSVPSNEFVTLKVYDVLGNTVSTLVNETKEAGKYNVSFDASNLTSGIYFYSINAGGFTQVKKMMLVK